MSMSLLTAFGDPNTAENPVCCIGVSKTILSKHDSAVDHRGLLFLWSLGYTGTPAVLVLLLCGATPPPPKGGHCHFVAVPSPPWGGTVMWGGDFRGGGQSI